MAVRLLLRHVTRLCLRITVRRLPRPIRLSSYTPPSHTLATFATFSGNSSEDIDLISLRRRVHSADLAVPFRTSLDAAASLNGLYDPSLVERALVSVSMKLASDSGPASDNQSHAAAIEEFVRRFNGELTVLADFIRSSYASSLGSLSQLSAVELSNVIYIFRDMYTKGKVPAVDLKNLAAYDDMVASFWSLLEHSGDRSRVPYIVGWLLESSRLIYVDLYTLGIGNFLSELRVLATEFDFTTLKSLDPVVAKISALVSEFSRYLQDHDSTRDYDLEFFRVVIYVLRYRKLQDILVAVGQKNISPRDLLALTKDPSAESIQQLLGVESGEPQKLEDLFFVHHRNFFNVIYTMVGLPQFDTIFATLYLEAQNPGYTESEKSQIDNFLETFLPLVCGGLVPIDALQDTKYSCLPVRYNGKVLAPIKVSNNIFDNYGFSLAVLFDIPSYLYLIETASTHLKKPFEASSIEEVSKVLHLAVKGSSLMENEINAFVASLKEMHPYCIHNLRILDQLVSQAPLIRATNEKVSHYAYVAKVDPEIVDLTSTMAASGGAHGSSQSSIRVNGRELSDFKNELADFKSKDLCDIPYTSIGDVNVIKLLSSRVSDVILSDVSKTDSAVNPENVASYATILELLTATFDINGGDVTLLESLIKDVKPQPKELFFPEVTTEYCQIPEYLKIHDFTTELEILRLDELKSPFKDYTPEQILSLMKDRFVEFNDGLPNSNPSSRMVPANLARFMRLSGRLEQLFDLNNGNTEVLDAVLGSHSELQKLEARLETQRKEREVRKEFEQEAKKALEPDTKSLYAPGPYLQIPDKMQLHEFVKELEIFRHDDLRSSFKNFSAEKILGLMQKRIKEIYNDLPCTNHALRMSKDNLIAFIKLHAKLEKLLAWNGGNTGILDTLIHSQSVFNDFEDKLSKRKESNDARASSSVTTSENNVYRQLMDDMMFEEFAEELMAIKQKIGRNFKSSTPDEILTALQELTDSETSMDSKVLLGKLSRNLKVLFKHNNDQTFVLDNVLLNAEAFKSFEKNLEDTKSADNKFDMSEFLKDEKCAASPVDYHKEDYVLSLLNSNSTPAGVDLETDVTIKEAVTSALSKAENKLFEEDPEEYAAINNLTAQKIRESYAKHNISTKEFKRIDKESLEKFLKSTKVESDKQAEQKWREKQAYEWSSTMANSQRSLESGNFFNSLSLRRKSSDFPMFPATENKEYLVLTPAGQTFTSKENPLGSNHVAEDMLAILDKFNESELEKFSKNVKKLQKKHWKLIGGGGSERMLVLSRPTVARKKKVLTRIKTLLASTGSVFLALIGLNIWLDDIQQDVPQQVPITEDGVENPEVVVVSEPQPEPEVVSTPLPKSSSKSLWQRLMWKD